MYNDNEPLADENGVSTDSDSEWLDRLPVGTVVSSAALRRWQRHWGHDAYHWLMVGCSASFDYVRYVHWLNELPMVGVIVDPTDPRYQRFILEHSSVEFAG